jgi:hypothetical protein
MSAQSLPASGPFAPAELSNILATHLNSKGSRMTSGSPELPSENRSFLKEMAFLNVLTVAFTSGLFRSGVVRSLGFFFPYYYQIGVYHVHEGI